MPQLVMNFHSGLVCHSQNLETTEHPSTGSWISCVAPMKYYSKILDARNTIGEYQNNSTVLNMYIEYICTYSMYLYDPMNWSKSRKWKLNYGAEQTNGFWEVGVEGSESAGSTAGVGWQTHLLPWFSRMRKYDKTAAHALNLSQCVCFIMLQFYGCLRYSWGWPTGMCHPTPLTTSHFLNTVFKKQKVCSWEENAGGFCWWTWQRWWWRSAIISQAKCAFLLHPEKTRVQQGPAACDSGFPERPC